MNHKREEVSLLGPEWYHYYGAQYLFALSTTLRKGCLAK